MRIMHMLAISRTGSVVRLELDAAVQRVYSIDTRTNIVAGSWTVLTNVTGSGVSTNFAPPAANGAYYRFRARVQ